MTRALSNHAGDARPGEPRGRSNERSKATQSARGEPVVTALEQETIQEALARLPEATARVELLKRRFEPYLQLPPGARVLDVGAALGVHLVAWNRAGYEAVGVEPWDEAVQRSVEVQRETAASFKIVQGEGERLPFEDESFDLVSAISVLEHTHDPERVFAEAHRVLRPSGGFYFYTTSAICPRQSEIRLFPAFPWYPDRARKGIMRWATEHHPSLVHGTTAPAYHWFTPRDVRRSLHDVGFSRVVDRWSLRAENEDHGWRRSVARAARANSAARLAADVLVKDSAYLALR